MQEVDQNLQKAAKTLDDHELREVSNYAMKGKYNFKEQGTVQYYFTKVMQDNVKQRQLILQYHQALQDGNLDLSQFGGNDESIIEYSGD